MKASASIRFTCALALILGAWLLPATSDAQSSHASDEEARGLFVAGRAAYSDGRYQEAYDRFMEAYRLTGRPGLLYNAAQAADRARMDPEALGAYESYLEADPDASNASAVRNRIAAIRGSMEREAALRQENERLEAEQEAAAIARARDVPSPEEAAATTAGAGGEEGAPRGATEGRPEDEGLSTGAWIGIGSGAAAAVIVAVVLAVVIPSDSTESPVAGSSGVIVTALGASR